MAMYRAAFVLAFGCLAACSSSDTSAAPPDTTADPQDAALAEWCDAVIESQIERSLAGIDLAAAIGEAGRLEFGSDDFSSAARDDPDQLMSEVFRRVERRQQAERDIVRSATQLKALTAPLAATAPDDAAGHFETLLDRYEALSTTGTASTNLDADAYIAAQDEITDAVDERCRS